MRVKNSISQNAFEPKLSQEAKTEASRCSIIKLSNSTMTTSDSKAASHQIVSPLKTPFVNILMFDKNMNKFNSKFQPLIPNCNLIYLPALKAKRNIFSKMRRHKAFF